MKPCIWNENWKNNFYISHAPFKIHHIRVVCILTFWLDDPHVISRHLPASPFKCKSTTSWCTDTFMFKWDGDTYLLQFTLFMCLSYRVKNTVCFAQYCTNLISFRTDLNCWSEDLDFAAFRKTWSRLFSTPRWRIWRSSVTKPVIRFIALKSIHSKMFSSWDFKNMPNLVN